MKKILLIYAGPNQSGLNWELFLELHRFLTASNYSLNSIDLYREDFDPVVREKEPVINQKMVSNYQEMIKTADAIIMISPVWWSRCTTMLEGFFDKVFSPGFAFKTDPKWQPLLSDKKLIMFLTLGNKSRLRRIIYYLITSLRLKLGPLRDCFGTNTGINFFVSDKSTTTTHKAICLEKSRGIIRTNL